VLVSGDESRARLGAFLWTLKGILSQSSSPCNFGTAIDRSTGGGVISVSLTHRCRVRHRWLPFAVRRSASTFRSSRAQIMTACLRGRPGLNSTSRCRCLASAFNHEAHLLSSGIAPTFNDCCFFTRSPSHRQTPSLQRCLVRQTSCFRAPGAAQLSTTSVFASAHPSGDRLRLRVHLFLSVHLYPQLYDRGARHRHSACREVCLRSRRRLSTMSRSQSGSRSSCLDLQISTRARTQRFPPSAHSIPR
jgi:hypothetical protein